MPRLFTPVYPVTSGMETVYVVHRISGCPSDGFNEAMPEEHTTDSAYLSEDQAYATAIRRQVAYMERQTGDTIVELRTLVTDKGKSLKDRFEMMREWIDRTDWFADAEVVEFHVEQCPLGRLETVDDTKLLEDIDDLFSEDCSEYDTDEEDESVEDQILEHEVTLPHGEAKKRRRD